MAELTAWHVAALLAALLQASGITLYPALISSAAARPNCAYTRMRGSRCRPPAMPRPPVIIKPAKSHLNI